VLGHANIGITLDTYSHVLPNMQEKAVAAMDAIFEGSVAGYRQDGVLVRTALPIKTAGAMSHLGFMGYPLRSVPYPLRLGHRKEEGDHTFGDRQLLCGANSVRRM
jgi:hypothetical protein